MAPVCRTPSHRERHQQSDEGDVPDDRNRRPPRCPLGERWIAVYRVMTSSPEGEDGENWRKLFEVVDAGGWEATQGAAAEEGAQSG